MKVNIPSLCFEINLSNTVEIRKTIPDFLLSMIVKVEKIEKEVDEKEESSSSLTNFFNYNIFSLEINILLNIVILPHI